MPTLCTLETVKHYVNIGSADTTRDGVLIGLLEAVEAEFISECSWGIASSSTTEYFIGNGKTERTFDIRPITAVVSLAAEDDVGDDTWTTIATTEYRLRDSKGRYYLRYPAGFAGGMEYRVTYTAGYADDAIPADIQGIIATWTAINWTQLEKSGKGLLPHQVSRNKADKGISVGESFIKPYSEWRAVVSRYRRMPL